MNKFALLFAWVYLITILYACVMTNSFLWWPILLTLVALLQINKILRASKFLAIVFGFQTIIYIISATNIGGVIDILYAGFFAWYFFKNS